MYNWNISQKRVGIKKKLDGNFYFIFLIVFFVLNGWNNYFELVNYFSVFKIFCCLFLGATGYFALTALIFKSIQKAGIFTTVTFIFALFFFIIKDFLFFVFKSKLAFETQFIILIIFLSLCFILLKISKKKQERLIRLFNISTISLMFFESVRLVVSFWNQESISKESFLENKIEITRINKKPSVYLILLDEYAGAESLKRAYGFSNSSFLDSLQRMNFKVIRNAKSNYNHTMLSMPSILNGEYLQFPRNQPSYSGKGFRQALINMYSNKSFITFLQLGYKVYNISPFSIDGFPPAYHNRFLPTDYMLILYPSVFDDLLATFPVYFAKKTNNISSLKRYYKKEVSMNYEMMNQVLFQSCNKQTLPQFTYLHLMMPHAPFAVDSTGKINIDFLSAKNNNKQKTRDAYLQYLVHTNNVILKFVNQLITNTNRDAVILLMSDHGSRDLNFTGEQQPQAFNSLNAIYYPGKDSVRWYNGMSNVNQFRILFSVIAKKQIPLLKDSLVLK